MANPKGDLRARKRARQQQEEHGLPRPDMEEPDMEEVVRLNPTKQPIADTQQLLKEIGYTFEGFSTQEGKIKREVADMPREKKGPTEKHTAPLHTLKPDDFPKPKAPASPKPAVPAQQGPLATLASLLRESDSIEADMVRMGEEKASFKDYMRLIDERLSPQLAAAKLEGNHALAAKLEGHIKQARAAHRGVDEELKRRETAAQQASFDSLLEPMSARGTHTIHDALDALKGDQTIRPVIPPVILGAGTLVPAPAAQQTMTRPSADRPYAYTTVPLTKPAAVLLELSGEMKPGKSGGEYLEVRARVIAQTPNIHFDQHTGWKDGEKGVFDIHPRPLRDAENKILGFSFVRDESRIPSIRASDRFDQLKVHLTKNYQAEWEAIVKVRQEVWREKQQHEYADMLRREKAEATLTPIGAVIERLPGKVGLTSTFIGGVRGQPCERYAEVVLERKPGEDVHVVVVWANPSDPRGTKFHALCHGDTVIPFTIEEREPVELELDAEGNPVLDEQTKLPIGTGKVFCRIPDEYKSTPAWPAISYEAGELGNLARQCMLNEMLELRQKGTPYVRPEPEPAPDPKNAEEVTAEAVPETVPA